MRYSGEVDYKEAIGFIIVRSGTSAEGRHPKALTRLTQIDRPEDIVYKSPNEFSRYVATTITLPAHEGVYYLIGYMFSPTDGGTTISFDQ